MGVWLCLCPRSLCCLVLSLNHAKRARRRAQRECSILDSNPEMTTVRRSVHETYSAVTPKHVLLERFPQLNGTFEPFDPLHSLVLNSRPVPQLQLYEGYLLMTILKDQLTTSSVVQRCPSWALSKSQLLVVHLSHMRTTPRTFLLLFHRESTCWNALSPATSTVPMHGSGFKLRTTTLQTYHPVPPPASWTAARASTPSGCFKNDAIQTVINRWEPEGPLYTVYITLRPRLGSGTPCSKATCRRLDRRAQESSSISREKVPLSLFSGGFRMLTFHHSEGMTRTSSEYTELVGEKRQASMYKAKGPDGDRWWTQ